MRADTVFLNGNVYTIDASNPKAEALAVLHGRVLAVGSTEEIKALAGPNTRVIDLGGRTLMPGMFTCHFHATYHELGSQPNTPYGDEYPPSAAATTTPGWMFSGIQPAMTSTP